MVEIKKEVSKDYEDMNTLDFVKIFLRLYKDEYQQTYPVNFKRDCSIMSKVADKLYMYGQANDEIVKFIRWAWKRKKGYKKEKYSTMRLGFFYSIVDDYIKLKGFKKIEVKHSQTETELDKEMKDWLERERNK